MAGAAGSQTRSRVSDRDINLRKNLTAQLCSKAPERFPLPRLSSLAQGIGKRLGRRGGATPGLPPSAGRERVCTSCPRVPTALPPGCHVLPAPLRTHRQGAVEAPRKAGGRGMGASGVRPAAEWT